MHTLLKEWSHGAIVISHDRELLENMDVIVELSSLGARKYGGNWSHYRERKAQELEAAQHDLAHAQKRLAEVGRDAQVAVERKARRDAAGRRKSAKGGEPPILLGARKDRAEDSGGVGARLAERRRSEAAEGLSAARGRLEVIQPFTVALAPSGLPAGKTVLEVNAVTAGYEPGQPIVRDVSFSITGPERVAVQGRNGSGKTTLLQVISGKLAPWAGSVRLGVPFAMLDQQVSLLIPQLSIRDNYRKLNPDSDENACRSSLARFRFRADAALQTVATLSGGQLLRAGLACVLGGTHPPPLLILDEGQMTTLPPSGMPSWSSTRTLKGRTSQRNCSSGQSSTLVFQSPPSSTAETRAFTPGCAWMLPTLRNTMREWTQYMGSSTLPRWNLPTATRCGSRGARRGGAPRKVK
nr:ATP-binding cassette domain-containing protein [Verrucomicrobium spinosum]